MEHDCPLIIGKTYYDKGFFNIGVDYSDYIRGDEGQISVFLNSNTHKLVGRVNRSANINGTPRIIVGPELTNWLHKNCNLGDCVSVEILGPDAIKIITDSTSTPPQKQMHDRSRKKLSRINKKNDVLTGVTNFHNSMMDDPYHRFRSWEHCFQFFKKNPAETEYDLASLHLGFYLASWGMYRGSSFLLQKDYRIHEGAVKEILKPRYERLKAISLDSLHKNNENEVELTFELIDKLKDFYKETTELPKREVNVTDTLATKILMGTLGCIPAYDRFFIVGIKYHGLSYSYLNKKNLREMVAFCFEHKQDFEKA